MVRLLLATILTILITGNAMPGFGDFLLGFSGAMSDEITADRKREREAEDNELRTRGAILQTMIQSMSNNPANAPLVQKAWADYLDTAGAVGKKRKAKGGREGYYGATELPTSNFLNMVHAGQVPAFGKVGLDLPKLNINGPDADPQLQSQNGVPMPPPPTATAPPPNPLAEASGPRSMGGPNAPHPSPLAMQGPVGPPPQPQMHVPQPPGTGRMNESVNQAAISQAADPFPEPTYSPGMMLSPVDQSKLEGIKDYTTSRLKQRALISNLQEVGASRDQIIDALIPGSSYGRSPFSPARLYISPDGHQFYGMADRYTGAVHMAGNPDQIVDGALPFGYQSQTTQDAQGNLINVYRPTLPTTTTGAPNWSVENTGVQGKPVTSEPLNQTLGPNGEAIWTPRSEAAGQRAPQGPGSNPDLIKANAEADYQNELRMIESRMRQNPGTQGYLSPEAAEISKRYAQEKYDAKIHYNREEGGGTLPAAPNAVKNAQGGLEYVVPSTTQGAAWYSTKQLPALAAGVGPNWNPPALARMRMYLEEKAKDRPGTVVTDAMVRQAMKSERFRVDAGLLPRP